jgi:hypothetical protein
MIAFISSFVRNHLKIFGKLGFFYHHAIQQVPLHSVCCAESGESFASDPKYILQNMFTYYGACLKVK